MKTNLLLALVALATSLFSSFAQPYGSAGEITKVTSDMTFMAFPYVEYLPSGYDGTTKFPLIISFGGTGEGGNGSSSALQKLVDRTMLKLVKNGVRTFDAIIISPQSGNGFFSPTNAKKVYDAAIAEYPVDLDRVYIAGFSAGGQATWQFASTYPDLPAAIIPICGAGTVSNPAPQLVTMPCWSHHNFGDNVVVYTKSRDNFMRISGGLNPTSKSSGIYPFNSSGGVADQDYTMHMDINVSGTDTTIGMSLSAGVVEPKDFHAFTLYKNGGHDAWTKTYANNDVWDWLFRQSRNGLITSTAGDLKTTGVNIFPNPSNKNEVTVEFGTSSFANQQVTVEVINKLGQVIYAQQTNGNTTLNTFPTTGVYTIKITSATDSVTKNVVIK